MFGRKCSLCNGRLNSNKICTECGLDNSKSEKYYKINQSSCDRQPLTHVHDENVRKPVNKPERKVTYQKPTGRKDTKETPVIGKIVSSFITVAVIISVAFNIFSGIFTEREPDYCTEELCETINPYENLTLEHPEEGEYYSCTLPAGEYVVGVHLPEGNYTATTFDEYDKIVVDDYENDIYLYEYEAKDEVNYLDDIRLFNGAVVIIESDIGILINTHNAQVQTQTNMQENPVTEMVYLENSSEAVAGEDFEPGVYDVLVPGEWGCLTLQIPDENGDMWEYRNLDLGTVGDLGTTYYNLVIPEGALLHCMDSNAELTPSGMISTTDYINYYH